MTRTNFFCLLFIACLPTRELRALDKGRAIGWNKFACNVSEELIKQIAEAVVRTGMKDAGYQYIVTDDCWQVDRDSQVNIIADFQGKNGVQRRSAHYPRGCPSFHNLY